MYEFGVGAEQQTLPAFTGGTPAEVVILPGAESEKPAWRLLELGSLTGRPWRAKVTWGYAAGVNPTALCDVPSATRICLFARSLTVHGFNQSNAENRVRVLATAVPGPIPTQNQLAYHLTAPTNEPIDVPAFARSVWVDSAELAAPVELTLDDPDNTAIARFVSPLPGGGVPLALCNRVRVTCAVRCRVVFALTW